jgi:hypothetical protein
MTALVVERGAWHIDAAAACLGGLRGLDVLGSLGALDGLGSLRGQNGLRDLAVVVEALLHVAAVDDVDDVDAAAVDGDTATLVDGDLVSHHSRSFDHMDAERAVLLALTRRVVDMAHGPDTDLEDPTSAPARGLHAWGL